MNCDQFREIVHDVARDEGLGISALNEALEHADRCEDCDALLNEAEGLTANLNALATQYASEAAPARVEAALLRSFRETHAPTARSGRVWLWSFTGLGGAVAAALLMMVLVQHATHVSPTPTALEMSAGLMAHPGDGAAASEETESASAAGLPADLTEGWPVAFDGGAASGSFTPLTAAFDSSALDLNSIVRVSMSRSALQNLGVYLDVETNEPVVADLVVANDGTPQAIRVVSW